MPNDCLSPSRIARYFYHECERYTAHRYNDACLTIFFEFWSPPLHIGGNRVTHNPIFYSVMHKGVGYGADQAQ